MKLRVACILGVRANAWHTEVLEHVDDDIEVTVVGTGAGRYPTGEIRLPLVTLDWENQVGSWFQRRARNLRYRLLHRFGDEFRLADPGERLQSFDLLHTWELFTDWTRVALEERTRRSVPVVVSVWDNIAGHFASDRRRGPVRRRALAETDRFHVVSAGARAALAVDGVPAERIAVTAPSVDGERFHPGRAEALRAAFGLSDSSVLVLAVARLAPEKGLGHLIDAMALTRMLGAPVELAIAGDGAERGILERRVQVLGLQSSVRFLGSYPFATMPELYRAADLFVLPSVATADWQEQWGQSLLEAMATGLACIGSRTGGIPEVLGDRGVLVTPANPGELGTAIAALAGDLRLRQALGKKARQRVEQCHLHRPQGAALSELYRSVVKAQRGGRPR